MVARPLGSGLRHIGSSPSVDVGCLLRWEEVANHHGHVKRSPPRRRLPGKRRGASSPRRSDGNTRRHLRELVDCALICGGNLSYHRERFTFAPVGKERHELPTGGVTRDSHLAPGTRAARERLAGQTGTRVAAGSPSSSNAEKPPMQAALTQFFRWLQMVGVAGFEPTTPSPPD